LAKQQTLVTKSADAPELDRAGGPQIPPTQPGFGFNPGRSLRTWAAYEGRLWQRALNSPAPYALLFGLLLLFSLAWQVPFRYTLDSSNELKLDQPFMRNLNDIEKTTQGEWFRWSKGEGTVDFPGAGKRAYHYEITAAGGIKPDTPYVLFANETKIAEGILEPGQKTYAFDIPAHAVPGKNGNLRLTLKVEGVVPAQLTPGSTDRRELGFPFFSARITPTGDGPVVPPFTQLGWLIGSVMLAYFLLARAGFSPWRAVIGAGLLALIPAWVVASPGARPWLTIFSDKITFAFGWALIMVVLADVPLRRVWSFGRERRWVLSIFGLTLALHLLGLLHPQTDTTVNKIVDLGFHLHRFEALWDLGLWWDKIASGEWGGRETYYPPVTYLLMGPFNLLIPDRRLLLLLWMTTFEASRVLLMFYLVKKVTGQGRAAIIAALFMAILPVNTLSLAWGQVANLMGEWFILAALCLVAVKWDTLRRPLTFGLLTLALFLSFLVHPGEVVVSGVVFLAAGIVLWLRRESRKQATVMLAAFLLAVALAIGSYHWVTMRDMVPQALDSLNNKVQGKPEFTAKKDDIHAFYVGGSVGDPRLGLVRRQGVDTVGELITGGLKGFWSEARVYYAVFPLLMLPWGLWWLWRSSRQRETGQEEQANRAARRLFWIGLVWVGTTVVFALVGLLLNLYVRYSLFLLPIVALCAGLFLDRLWARQEQRGRGWTGMLLTVSLGSWITIGTLALFFDRLIYYGH
jgi:hypothetical protein